MGKNIKISVIMPSLNVETYITACLESVLNQSLVEIEIFCIDAGSTDGTLEIICRYAERDARVHLIKSPQKSYGYQVNCGIRNAKGEYIAIVDTDDIVSSDMYEKLYDVAVKNNADIIKANYYEIVQMNEILHIKREVPIVPECLYNHVVNILEKQECFQTQVTATWSGIYKREFIIQNGIWHNETAGASYQDTGFWFLSYAFAKRAYFIRQPFYQYRVDNPNSSVNSKDKIFCISDEMKYIYYKLCEKNAFDAFRDTFCYIFYRKYKRNMERIDQSYQMDFLKCFSREFGYLLQKEKMDVVKWKESEKNDILNIIYSPENYYYYKLEQRRRFINKLEKMKIIIYGIGKVGKQLYCEMKNNDQIIGFAVSDNSSNGEIYGKPIRCIEDWTEYKYTATVVIAVKIEEYIQQMTLNCQRLGFKNIEKIPDGIMDF